MNIGAVFQYTVNKRGKASRLSCTTASHTHSRRVLQLVVSSYEAGLKGVCVCVCNPD